MVILFDPEAQCAGLGSADFQLAPGFVLCQLKADEHQLPLGRLVRHTDPTPCAKVILRGNSHKGFTCHLFSVGGRYLFITEDYGQKASKKFAMTSSRRPKFSGEALKAEFQRRCP